MTRLKKCNASVTHLLSVKRRLDASVGRWVSRALVIVMFLFFAASAAGQSIAEVECTNPAIPATTPSSEFTIVSDGSIIRHEVTRLEWQRCSMGQTWDGATCQGEAVGYFWQEALYIAATTVGDWRLPNI